MFDSFGKHRKHRRVHGKLHASHGIPRERAFVVNAVSGAGSVAKGTGKGTLDVVTLHPVKGAKSVGKGAAGAGKDVTVGTVKGTGKIGKGIGKAIGKVF